jgi:hypothetical protein
MNNIFNNKLFIPGNNYLFIRKKKFKYNKQYIFYATFIEIKNNTLKVEKYMDITVYEKDGYLVLPISWIKNIYSIEKYYCSFH